MFDQFIARDLGGDSDMGLLSTLGQHNDVVLGGLGTTSLKSLVKPGSLGPDRGLDNAGLHLPNQN